MKTRNVEGRSEITKAIIIILIGFITFSLSVPFISVADSTGPIPLAVDYTCAANGDWDVGTTWGGALFPGAGDTWAIPEGFIVNITGAQASGTGWNNGTLMFNCSTGTASLTLDNGAILTNNGLVNQTASSAVNTASLIGDSLEVFAGTSPVWNDTSDAFWNWTEIDFQFNIVTGDAGNVFEINGNCRFDSILIEDGDTVDGNDQTLELDGNLTYADTGAFTRGTSTVNWRSNGTTNIGTFYNITIDDDAFLTITENMGYTNVLTIDGTTGGGITGSDYNVQSVGTVETPLVMGSNGLLTGIDYFAYLNIGTYNITASNNYGDLRCYTSGVPGSSSATMLGAVTCDNLTVYSGSPPAPFDFDTGSNDLTINYGLTVGVSFGGVLKCNGSLINIGVDGITLAGGGVIDADTSIIQSDGDLDFTSGTFTADTNTVVITDNASITGDVSFYNLTIDVGKTATTYDTDNDMVWSNLMIVNGTLDTLTNGDWMVLDSNTAGGEIIQLGPSGSLASANIEVSGDGAYEIPGATYNRLTLFQNNVGTNQYVLTGDIVTNDYFTLAAITSLTRILEFYTDDYNITVGTSFIVNGTAGITNASLNNSVVDVGTFLVIAASGTLNCNTSTIELAGNLTNPAGVFNAGTSTLILDGTTAQSITNGGDMFATLNVTNSNAAITFQDEANITNGIFSSGTNIILTANMTINNLTTTGAVFESSNESVDRSLFNPLENRSITSSNFNNVNLVPGQPRPPGGGAIPEIPEPAEVIEITEPAPERGICASTIFLIGIALGGGGITLFKFIKDPRRNGKC